MDDHQQDPPFDGENPEDTRRRKWVAVVVVLAIAAVVLGVVLTLLIVGGDDDSGEAATTTSRPSSTTTDTTSTSAPPTTTAATTTTGATNTGRNLGYITVVEASGAHQSLTIDYAELLTGEDARTKYAEDGLGELDTDYYIRNVNPGLRTFPIADHATIVATLPPSFDPEPIPPGELTSLINDDAAWAAANPFWITLESGTITAIEQQYLP